MKNNAHILLNACTHESRVLKETASLTSNGFAAKCYIFALEGAGLAQEETLDDKRTILRIPLKSRNWKRNPVSQLATYLEYLFRISQLVRKYEIDTINVHLLGLLPIGVFLKLFYKTQLVYDAHELETEVVLLSGIRKKVAKFVERALIRFVDLTIVVGPAIEKWYRDKYGISNIVTVKNCPLYQDRYVSDLLRETQNIPAEKKVLLYQGGLALGRGIEGILAAFDQRDTGGLVVVFMGYGGLEKLISDFAARNDNIFLQPAAPPEVVLQYTASADYGISYIDNPSLNDRYCLPNKMFEFVMAGLPVLVNDAPEMSDFVKSTGVGAVMAALTWSDIHKSIREIEGIPREKLEANLSKAAKENSWETQEKMMLKAYSEFVH